MKNQTRIGIGLLLLVQGLAGCAGSSASSPSPTTPTAVAPQPTAPTPGPFNYGAGFILYGVGLSGAITEMTSAGQVPVAGVSVYCDACGEFGHTFVSTDANGFYRFEGDVSRGGGVWLSGGSPVALLVRKEGYDVSNPAGTFPDGTGRKYVAVTGDTRFDILLVKR